MKTNLTLFLLPFVLITEPVCAQDEQQLIAPGAELQVLAKEFKFTEGPAVDKNGNVYFTDQPNDRIFRWSVDGQISLFQEGQGRANGLYFDRNGHLLSCSDRHNELRSIDMNGNYTILVEGYDGKLLNGPNDVWIHPNGGIYFTDPLYKRDYWVRDPEMQQDGEHVYYLSPDRKTLVRVATDLKKPNGIIGTPDGKKLYVADIGDSKTYVYDMAADGSINNKTLFTEMGSDGMSMDERGNIYLTGRGVTVFNPKGEQIEHIPIETGWTANVCFGGKEMKTLFITATEYLYTLQMNVKGAMAKQP